MVQYLHWRLYIFDSKVVYKVVVVVVVVVMVMVVHLNPIALLRYYCYCDWRFSITNSLSSRQFVLIESPGAQIANQLP